MTQITINDVERAVQTAAATALQNIQYFSELDAAAGDADFGVSLGSGFKALQEQWDDLDRSSISSFLLKVSVLITSNVGGCSGPIWGTGFMRAGMLSKEKDELTLGDLAEMLAGSIDGIKKRGGAEEGDKTLLDALIPIQKVLADAAANDDDDTRKALQECTRVANEAIERTRDWTAKRGRQSFTGERSKGTVDPGIVAIATMLNDISAEFGVSESQ